MDLALNLLYLFAALAWLGMVLKQTLDPTLPDSVHTDWPMRRFWISERLRRISLFLLFLSATVLIVLVTIGGMGVDRSGATPALFVAGFLLAAAGAAALTYAVLLYRRPSGPKPDRF